MNTTKLIAHWTMRGAARDIDGRFRTTDDIREILVGDRDARAAAASMPLQVRRADEEDWVPLGAEGDAGGRVW